MSGHSKWHNIRLRKGKVDAQRGALFTKLSKEIILAARSGSPDPEANYRLKMSIEKARESNMPQENIKRAIARGSGLENEKLIEELRYEGYGPHGVAVVVDAATDNRNRTAGELRFLFQKNGGTMGETGTVGWMFNPVGVLEIDTAGRSEEMLLEAAMVDGVLDLEYDPARSIIFTTPTSLSTVREAFVALGLRVTEMYLGMRPKIKVAPSDAQAGNVFDFLAALDDHEDIVRIFSNVDFDAASMGAPV